MAPEIGNNLVIACRRIDTISISEKHCLEMFNNNNKQLLVEVEAEHDIKNYPDRGQCYLPKSKAEVHNIDQGLDNSSYT